MKWVLYIELLSLSFHEGYLTRQSCLDALLEVYVVAVGDFMSGACEDGDDPTSVADLRDIFVHEEK